MDNNIHKSAFMAAFHEETRNGNFGAGLNEPEKLEIPHPTEIKEYLDRFVVGQEEAKKAISTLLVNHLVKSEYNKDIEKDTRKLKKSNVLLVGDSGVGKTHVVKVASEFLDIPIVIEDATKLTQEGYVGDSVDTILTRLFIEAEGDLDKVERGIIFIDEFDKLSDSTDSKSNVSTTAVQQSLLKMVEGGEFHVSDSLGDERKAGKVPINTSNITFIFAGAFGGLASKVKGEVKLGITKEKAKGRDINEEDIIKYGILPEILGRIGRYIVLHELSDSQMLQILTKTENCLVDQYKKLFELRGLEWTLEEKDYVAMIKHVKKTKLGARGLMHQMETKLDKSMFDEQ